MTFSIFMKKIVFSIFIVLGVSGCVSLNDNAHINKQHELRVQQPVVAWINVDSILVKDAPNGNEIGTLAGGQSVSVYKHFNSWAKISKDNESPRWVSSLLLCEYDGCYIPSPTYLEPRHSSQPIHEYRMRENTRGTSQTKTGTKVRTQAKTKTVYSAPAKVYKKTYTPTSSSNCPCSAANYCVGPRGGHYCITSGGNKRYLPR